MYQSLRLIAMVILMIVSPMDAAMQATLALLPLAAAAFKISYYLTKIYKDIIMLPIMELLLQHLLLVVGWH